MWPPFAASWPRRSVAHWAGLTNDTGGSVVVLGVLAALGLSACLYATHFGPGLQSDSVAYLGGARQLLDGRGYTVVYPGGILKPITNWPPLYSVALAGLGALGIDLPQGARWLNAVLFGVTVFLGAATIRHLTAGSGRAAIFGAFLLLASVDLLQVYSEVQSEPLFIVLGVLCLMLLGRYLERPEPLYLIGAGAAAGMACATRYAGAVLLAMGVMALLLARRGWRPRLQDSVVFAGLGSFPVAIFALRNRLVTAPALGESRVLAFHPVPLAKLQVGLNTVWGWLVPDRSLAGSLASLVGQVRGFRWMALTLAVLTGVLVILRERRRLGISRATPTAAGRTACFDSIWLPISFLFLYAAFLLVSISFLDLETDLDARMLSPAFVATVVAGTVLADRVLTVTRSSRLAVAAAWVGAVLIGVSYSHAAIRWIHGAHDGGPELEYGSRLWRESDILRKVRRLSNGVLIYSNDAEVIRLITGRSAVDLPDKIKVATGQTNPNYQLELDRVREQFRAGAVLVYLNRVPWRQPHYGTEAELVGRLHLHLLSAGADGSIFGGVPQQHTGLRWK